MLCTNCHEKPILAKGLCGACYHRLRKMGTVERTNVRNTGLCSVEGCERAAFAKNMCAHHYEKAQHPLKATWKLIRSRNPGAYPAEWDRFEAFLKAVGERPSPKHQLARLDTSLPYSMANIEWKAPLGLPKQSYSPEQQAAYGREWNLQKRFKITGTEYAALLNAQGGGCAVCGGQETHTYPSGKPKDLAVDHNHETGNVRGLLCFNCNQGIGRFQDDATRLRAAAAYLERHAKPPTETEERLAEERAKAVLPIQRGIVAMWNRTYNDGGSDAA